MKQFLFTLILCFFVHTCSLYAEEIIVPTDNYPPWKIVDKGTITGGIDIELTAALLDGLSLTPRYLPAPWKRCLLMLKEGTGDLLSGVTLNKQRQEYLIYLTPPYKTRSQKILYVRRGAGSSFQNIADFEQKRIGILRGARYFPSFDQNPSIFKNMVDSDLQGMKMLAAGRLDGFLITKENGEYLLQKHPEMREYLERATWYYNKNLDVYFAISKYSNLVKRKKDLELRLHHLIESGKIDEIIRAFSNN